MKKILVLILLSLCITQAVEASTTKHHAAPVVTNEAQLVEHGSYTNKAGNTVHSPAHTTNGKAPAGASAKCGDGSYSFSQSHRGTCSRHGGVAEWE